MTIYNTPATIAALCLCMFVFALADCQYPTALNATAVTKPIKDTAQINKPPVVKTTPAAATIMNRPQVPVLCYHQIRNWRATDSRQAKDYIVPVAAFEQQIKMLADSGYHTISADQLYDYLISGAALPAKPVMLTFDDTDLPQYTVAKPTMEKYGFKGLFFIMTVSLESPII